MDAAMPRPRSSTAQDHTEIGGDSASRNNGSGPAQITQSNYLVPRASCSNSVYVLLGTATVYLLDKKGKQPECRALLDSCSQPHIMTHNLCRRLGLPRTKSKVTLMGIEQGAQPMSYQTTVELRSRITDFAEKITCIILDKISDNLPSAHACLSEIRVPKRIELADPHYDRSRPVDLLIGAGLFYRLLCVGQIRLKHNQPIFQKTLLGWIVTGELHSRTQQPRAACHLIKNVELSQQLERFWEIEHGFGEPKSENILKNDHSEQHFRATTERDEDGRFVVSIPFRTWRNWATPKRWPIITQPIYYFHPFIELVLRHTFLQVLFKHLLQNSLILHLIRHIVQNYLGAYSAWQVGLQP